MKTNILSLIFLFTFAFANASNIISVTTKAHDLHISMDRVAKYGATISITDQSGLTLVKEEIAPNTTSKRFDMSQLPTGAYTLAVENHMQVIDYTVNVTTIGITTSTEEVTYKPNVVIKEGNLNISLMTLGRNASVQIASNQGDVVYAEDFNTPAVMKSYLTSELPTGDYTVAVTNNNKTYYFEIKK